ncbi:hypothetical protein Purlil1_3667 [Purpureocillium lilacinum]|uniref:Uncharacterized protein n=1 Tax=Purpureocillium lilacinum TaxID=33203 RepID=A0ABR0C624_PURLI|nr:hypothetical protein Purlil1_3667 [Purpureocillium lilacinum]
MPAPAATVMTTSSTANIPRLLARGSLTEGDVAAYSVASTAFTVLAGSSGMGPFSSSYFLFSHPTAPEASAAAYLVVLFYDFNRLISPSPTAPLAEAERPSTPARPPLGASMPASFITRTWQPRSRKRSQGGRWSFKDGSRERPRGATNGTPKQLGVVPGPPSQPQATGKLAGGRNACEEPVPRLPRDGLPFWALADNERVIERITRSPGGGLLLVQMARGIFAGP